MEKAQVFKLPTGANVHVGMAGFRAAGTLTNAVLDEVKGTLSPDDLKIDVEELRKNPQMVIGVIDRFIKIAKSKPIAAAVIDCAGWAKYAPKGDEALIAIDEKLFDDPEYGMQAREDYYHIAFRIAQVNCLPFFVKIFSMLKDAGAKTSSSPQSA